MEAANRLVAGDKVGKLTLIEPGRRYNKPAWVCACDCGGSIIAPNEWLKTGRAKSCGCLRASVLGDATRKHGRANSRVSGYKDRAYGIWQAMKDRCSNENRADYHRYGGRGITVCDRWRNSFELFIADMGEPASGMTLERLEKDGPYSPDNCVWADRKVQAANTSRNLTVVVGGVRKLAKDAAQENGICLATFRHRYYWYKWPLLQACGIEPRVKGDIADTYGAAK